MTMAVTLTVTIKDGVTTVTADGSKKSCDTAHDVEKAIGKVTKSTPTGTKTGTTTLVQK
jgi:hypothetical protein